MWLLFSHIPFVFFFLASDPHQNLHLKSELCVRSLWGPGNRRNKHWWRSILAEGVCPGTGKLDPFAAMHTFILPPFLGCLTSRHAEAPTHPQLTVQALLTSRLQTRKQQPTLCFLTRPTSCRRVPQPREASQPAEGPRAQSLPPGLLVAHPASSGCRPPAPRRSLSDVPGLCKGKGTRTCLPR